VGFIVTNLAASSRAVVWFYSKRGTAKQVAAGGESPDAPALWNHATEDHGAAIADGMT